MADTFFGRWMKYRDLITKNDRIALVPQEYIGKCRKECRTIQMACERTFENLDEMDKL